jgi:hypothetical protein
MPGVASFIDFDETGQPFMGLMVEDTTTQIRFYIAHKPQAQYAVDILVRNLQEMASTLRKTQPRLIEAKGNIDGVRRT